MKGKNNGKSILTYHFLQIRSALMMRIGHDTGFPFPVQLFRKAAFFEPSGEQDERAAVRFPADGPDVFRLFQMGIRQKQDVPGVLLKSFFRRNAVPLEELSEQAAALPEQDREVLEAVLALPSKYKDVVYLHYYEGYSAAEIGRILNKNVNTVYTLLSRAREQLKQTLGGDRL